MRLFFHQFNSYQFKSNAQVITYFSIFNYRSVIKISFLMPRAKIVEIFLLGSKCIRALKVIFLFVHNMHMNSHVCEASYCRKICQFISRLSHSFSNLFCAFALATIQFTSEGRSGNSIFYQRQQMRMHKYFDVLMYKYFLRTHFELVV